MCEAALVLRSLNCKDATVNGYLHEIRIEYNNTNLLLHYVVGDEKDDIGRGFFSLDEVDVSRLIIDNVSLADGCDARIDAYPENNVSYTATMYSIIRQIQHDYPESIESYAVGDYDLDDSDLLGCPENVEYGYRIYLKKEFWEDFSRLKALIESFVSSVVYFSDCYESYKGLAFADDYKFNFLGTNTKVRRLGYLGILISLFDNSQRIAKKNLSRLLELKAEEYAGSLDLYKNQKGVIRLSKTGISANPYIKLALELGVIREMVGHYELGKMGRVYQEVRKETHIRQTNPFELSSFEKMFWLERLLEQDYVYLLTLLEYGFVNDNPSYADLRRRFNGMVLKKLVDLYAAVRDPLPKVSLRNTIQRIKGWKKSEVYLEHILMPRLNWLYDLGLLELKSDLSFTLTEGGKVLLLNLAEWKDLRPANICNPTTYLEEFYMHVANDLFMESRGRDDYELSESLTRALTYSFEHFKTMAPNRVTYSVFQAFAKYTLLINKSLVVESSDIKEKYLPSIMDKYVFMYQRYYNDGFIQKK